MLLCPTSRTGPRGIYMDCTGGNTMDPQRGPQRVCTGLHTHLPAEGDQISMICPSALLHGRGLDEATWIPPAVTPWTLCGVHSVYAPACMYAAGMRFLVILSNRRIYGAGMRILVISPNRLSYAAGIRDLVVLSHLITYAAGILFLAILSNRLIHAAGI